MLLISKLDFAANMPRFTGWHQSPRKGGPRAAYTGSSHKTVTSVSLGFRKMQLQLSAIALTAEANEGERSMIKTVSGGCDCDSIRYKVELCPIRAMHCHCRQCQRLSGGPMATLIAFAETTFQIIRGTPKNYTYIADSGRSVDRYFCPDCGSALYGKSAGIPWIIFLIAPSLDDASWVKPSLHAYMASAQPWDPADDDLPRFDKLPPPEAEKAVPGFEAGVELGCGDELPI